MNSDPGSEHILIIKLGALGDFIQALSPMSAIRNHHPNARITLLTTSPYVELAKASGYVDEIEIDRRPRWNSPKKWLSLRRFLRSGQFTRVYDLQTSNRSSLYHRLFWPDSPPQWSGIASGCSHPHDNPNRNQMHTVERQAEQLAMAGIAETPRADLSWFDAETKHYKLSEYFMLLVPGGAAHRPRKRWPASSYSELAGALLEKKITPVLLGGAAEAPLLSEIADKAPGAVNLAGKTSFFEIGALARKAKAAIGNDTGPMHLISAIGCPSVILYSDNSDPALCAQRGKSVNILRRADLGDLSVSEVVKQLKIA